MYVCSFAGDAEGQWEEHVDQEALEVAENILISSDRRAVFVYIVMMNISRRCIRSFLPQDSRVLFVLTVCISHGSSLNFRNHKSEKSTEHTRMEYKYE